MLALQQEVLRPHNREDSEVVIDLREFGLGLVLIAPIAIKDSCKVRIGYTADQRVKIYRRRVFNRLLEEAAAAPPVAGEGT